MHDAYFLLPTTYQEMTLCSAYSYTDQPPGAGRCIREISASGARILKLGSSAISGLSSATCDYINGCWFPGCLWQQDSCASGLVVWGWMVWNLISFLGFVITPESVLLWDPGFSDSFEYTMLFRLLKRWLHVVLPDLLRGFWGIFAVASRGYVWDTEYSAEYSVYLEIALWSRG